MKKVLISLSIIAAAAAIAIGATTAFFSDTETSQGNTFTAGSVDLLVDSQCTYNSQSCATGNWGQTDGKNIDNEKFFDFGDIKPGDSGENTISLHIDDNPAYTCFYVSPLTNDEMTCTEPETEAEKLNNPPCTPGVAGNGYGELAQNIQFFAWEDLDGDNKWTENPKEPYLFSNVHGPASDVLSGKTYDLGITLGNTTRHIGVQWCAGTMTVDTNTHIITCSGTLMGNESQSDSMVGSVAFVVEQTRNNNGFTCPANPLLP